MQVKKFTNHKNIFKTISLAVLIAIVGTMASTVYAINIIYLPQNKNQQKESEITKPTQNTNSSGTISKGGVFTQQVRAFLDTIAKWESEGQDTLSRESYNSGNFVQNDFDAENSTDLHPPLASNGVAPDKNFAGWTEAYNIGRYQYYGDHKESHNVDVKDANEGLSQVGINFVIKDFKPTSQDYYPLGKYAYITKSSLTKDLGNGSEKNFFSVVKKASREWASMPFSTLGQPKATYTEYWQYFQQRLVGIKQEDKQNLNQTNPNPDLPKPQVPKMTLA
jgi:hypothetical protein